MLLFLVIYIFSLFLSLLQIVYWPIIQRGQKMNSPKIFIDSNWCFYLNCIPGPVASFFYCIINMFSIYLLFETPFELSKWFKNQHEYKCDTKQWKRRSCISEIIRISQPKDNQRHLHQKYLKPSGESSFLFHVKCTRWWWWWRRRRRE